MKQQKPITTQQPPNFTGPFEEMQKPDSRVNFLLTLTLILKLICSTDKGELLVPTAHLSQNNVFLRHTTFWQQGKDGPLTDQKVTVVWLMVSQVDSLTGEIF